MNILVDGRTFCRYAAGITTFLQCALREWAAQKPEDRFYVLLPKSIDSKVNAGLFPQNVQFLDYHHALTSHLPNILLLQVLVPRLCRRLNIDLYYSPVPHLPFGLPHRVQVLVVAHDVVNLEYPETMALTNRLAGKFFFSYAIRHADVLWYNSHYTQEKIHQYFPERRCRRELVGASVNDTIYNHQQLDTVVLQALRQRFGIHDRYVLFVGSLEPRKNLPFLVQLAPRLWTEHGLQLVVVGANKWKNSSLSSVVEADDFIRESVVFCGYVTDPELAVLYHGARCLVSASLNEGFGMPQLEALKCGCPILTANNSAMAEVAAGKDGAVTVDGYEPEVWIRQIARVVETRPEVNPDQLKEYDWEKIIGRLLDCLK